MSWKVCNSPIIHSFKFRASSFLFSFSHLNKTFWLLPPAKLLKEMSKKRRVGDFAKAIETIEYRFLIRMPVRERFKVCSLMFELLKASAILGKAPYKLL